MTVVVDTSAMLALLHGDDDFNPTAARFSASLDEELVTSPVAVAEMDHMIRRRAGRDGQQLLWINLEREALAVRWWADATQEMLRIVRDAPRLSLADASLVALCDRLRTERIFSFDPHFENLTTPNGRTLKRLPERTR